ncbi:hypothetical protein CTKZ_02020 [Cellulomonas algicola]|uniref:Uncharacterized protein n=1 Tax=Cellulomonas algicola TaxID=2071633 RepID=A0A401UVL3_9CELL|nr:hypothetical protein CTKZ_02020 [Cellulomonas algicola]
MADQVAQQLVPLLRARVVDVGARGHRELDDAEPVHAVEERHPQRERIPGRRHRLDVLERAARERPRDRDGVRVGQRRCRHRDQETPLVVDDPEPRGPAELTGRVVRGLRDPVGRSVRVRPLPLGAGRRRRDTARVE